jgi:hypothetical protein
VAPWFLAWWEQQGGKLHQHELSFMGELKRLVERKEKNEGWLSNYGAFLRLDLHLLVNRSSVPSNTEDEMVLYTDADVLFLKVRPNVGAACRNYQRAPGRAPGTMPAPTLRQRRTLYLWHPAAGHACRTSTAAACHGQRYWPSAARYIRMKSSTLA